MFRGKSFYRNRLCILILMMLVVGTLVACGQKKDAGTEENKSEENTSEEVSVEDTEKDTEAMADENTGSEKVNNTKENAENKTEAELKEMFGENCIADQTFEVELSEYSGKVYFVPFAPSGDKPDFHMQIIQDGEVLDNISAYIPEELENEKFTSLDAVSFWDVNYDDNTDIVLIQTYGTTTFAAIYYGFSADAEDYERFFYSEDELSKKVTSQVDELTIPKIRSYLTDGKKNGEFVSYEEAYEARSRLSELESNSEYAYDLIYFDEDEIPELVVADNGYFVSLYTFSDGKLYTLMERWPYGAGGNVGYEYSPGKNSLRNYNQDYAGAVVYTTYMTIGKSHSMDEVVQIKTLHFDDANGNGEPDEGETESAYSYSVSNSYIDGVAATQEECETYDVGGYEYIQGSMDLDTLLRRLK